MECRKKDGATVTVRLSGVSTGSGAFDGYEMIVGNVTEQQAQAERFRGPVDSDSLTGLANDRRLFEVLHTEISRSKRTGREFALMLLDVDQFKKINEQYGQLVGDRALRRLTNLLRSCSRSMDTAARQGGDEFALVLPETGAADAEVVGERISELLRKDVEEPALSVTVGVAAYPRDAESVGPLLYAADVALYARKGRRVKFVSAEPAIESSNNGGPRAASKSAQQASAKQ